MGNANAHERRKSGVPETGLTIENIREKPLTTEIKTLKQSPVIERIDKKTPPPSFNTEAQKEVKRKHVEPTVTEEFRPRAGTHSDKSTRIWKAPVTAPGSKGLPTIFKFAGNAKEVFVCGTFSEWEKIPMVKSQKDFVALVDLPVGEHQFKYYVDNEWTHDKTLPAVENDCGSKNNVITIQQDDFEAFSALDMDSKVTNIKHHRGAEAEFGQEIPGLNSFESKPGPPILPPHLLQVILNKDTPLSCEPTLLPEPNHVMINHLYALSIKDGVMVISSTQRFRKIC